MTEKSKEPKLRYIQKTNLKTQAETNLLDLIKQMDLSVNSNLPWEDIKSVPE